MRKCLILFLITCSAKAWGQPPPSCVIVKRHVYKFGENAARWHPHRPFDYIEGNYPEGYKWRSELSDGDVRDLQKKGGRVIILETGYTQEQLEEARKQCAQK